MHTMTRAARAATTTVLLLAAMAANTAYAGWQNGWIPRVFEPHQISSYSTTLVTSGDAADIYYPAVPGNFGNAFTDAFPVVIFLQGAIVDKEYYSIYAQGIARYGFVVIVPNHLRALLGEPTFFPEATVITDAMETLRREDNNADSPIRNIADTSRLGLSGHSFGGATGLFGAAGLCSFPFCRASDNFQMPPELAAAVFAGTHTYGTQLDTTGTPVALLAGSDEPSVDRIIEAYDMLATPRALVIIEGANHFGLNDSGLAQGVASDRGGDTQVVPQAITATHFARWAGLFFRAHIHQDPNAQRMAYRTSGDANVRVTGQQR